MGCALAQVSGSVPWRQSRARSLPSHLVVRSPLAWMRLSASVNGYVSSAAGKTHNVQQMGDFSCSYAGAPGMGDVGIDE